MSPVVNRSRSRELAVALLHGVNIVHQERWGLCCFPHRLYSVVLSFAIIFNPLLARSELESRAAIACQINHSKNAIAASWNSRALEYRTSYVLYGPSRVVIELTSRVRDDDYREWLDTIGASECSISVAQSLRDLTVTFRLPQGLEPCLSPSVDETGGRFTLWCEFLPSSPSVREMRGKPMAVHKGRKMKAALDSAEAEVFGNGSIAQSQVADRPSNDSPVVITLLAILLLVVFGQWYWIRTIRKGFLRSTEISRKEGFQIGKRLAQHHSQHPLDQQSESMSIDFAYRVLGAKAEWDDERLRNRYETVLRHNHPERLQSKGASAQEIQLARERLQYAHQAYHRIRVFRSR